jgi:hypothetical protein
MISKHGEQRDGASQLPLRPALVIGSLAVTTVTLGGLYLFSKEDLGSPVQEMPKRSGDLPLVQPAVDGIPNASRAKAAENSLVRSPPPPQLSEERRSRGHSPEVVGKAILRRMKNEIDQENIAAWKRSELRARGFSAEEIAKEFEEPAIATMVLGISSTDPHAQLTLRNQLELARGEGIEERNLPLITFQDQLPRFKPYDPNLQTWINLTTMLERGDSTMPDAEKENLAAQIATKEREAFEQYK